MGEKGERFEKMNRKAIVSFVLVVLFLVSVTRAPSEPSSTHYSPSTFDEPPATQWNMTYGGGGIDAAVSVRQTTDGGYIIAGYTNSYGAGGHDFWLVKTDASGNKIWDRTYGGANDSSPCFVQQTTDGGYITTGNTFTFGNDNDTADFWLVKTDASGNMVWNQTYGGAENDDAACVRQTTDGGYIVAGDTASFGAGLVDFWLVKVAPESQRGKILVDKVTVPAGSLQSFDFTTTAGAAFSLTDAAAPWDSGWIVPGTYTVTELAEAGWDLTSIGFSDADSTSAGAVATVRVAAGETVTVTFNNTQRARYDVTIAAHCITEGKDVSVAITEDGAPTGSNTPYTFTGLTGTHTFTVPGTDASGHPFKQWDTGETSTTITVSSRGTYKAYYRTPPVHAVAVNNIRPSKTVVGQSYSQNITGTVLDLGDYPEAFNVTVYANATTIGSENITLSAGNSMSVAFTWNATGFAYGNYTISSVADIVPNEADTTDNDYTSNVVVHVGVPGDISGPVQGVYDGKVDMRDISYLVLRFNSKPGSTNWNPNADINNDATVNMRDISIAILNFNKHE